LPLSATAPIFRDCDSALQFENNLSDPSTALPMASSSSNNYLRTYRKRSGLTQSEVAFLLGCKDAGQVSRYERRHRLPTLRTALACASILRVPLATLFAGVQQEVDRDAARRVAKLRSDLETKSPQNRHAKSTSKKLRWLTQTDGSSRNINKTR
jgi:transcriptional regulator with XRE-family HTH domain